MEEKVLYILLSYFNIINVCLRVLTRVGNSFSSYHKPQAHVISSITLVRRVWLGLCAILMPWADNIHAAVSDTPLIYGSVVQMAIVDPLSIGRNSSHRHDGGEI